MSKSKDVYLWDYKDESKNSLPNTPRPCDFSLEKSQATLSKKSKIFLDNEPPAPIRSTSPIIQTGKNHIRRFKEENHLNQSKYSETFESINVIKPTNSGVKNVVAKLPDIRIPVTNNIKSIIVPTHKILTGQDYAFEQMDKLTMIHEIKLIEQIKQFEKVRGRPDPITKKIVSSLKPILISVAPQDDQIICPQDKKVYFKSKILARPDYQIRISDYYKKYSCEFNLRPDWDNDIWKLTIYPS